jgi:hypothetical protein
MKAETLNAFNMNLLGSQDFSFPFSSFRLSQVAQKAPDARRARMGERRRTHVVRRSESIGVERSRWAFSASCMRKSRSVKHLAS